MSYVEAIDQLKAMVPELYTGQGHPRRKFSLDEIRALLQALGNPQREFRSVLIAGTNGKGSTAATLASILAAAGQRTGLYTSPHLVRPNERIRVDDGEIDDDAFGRLYFKVRRAAEQLLTAGSLPQLPSYFEMLTAIAFLHFAELKIDIAVLEVGMGGRLDATNVVDPLVSVITDISLDHTEWLGPTIGAIAREKSGILRLGGTMVTLPQHPEANLALGEAAMALEVRGINATPYLPVAPAADPYPVEVFGKQILVDSPLKGEHQHRNVALAIAAAVELAERHSFSVTESNIEKGIRETRWPGRLERIEARGINWILDVAHNPAGAWALRSGLKAALGNSSATTLVFSCLRDKPAEEMAQILFPVFDQVVLAPMQTARATPIADLEKAAAKTGTRSLVAESVESALGVAKQIAGATTVVVSGSVYLVGEVRALLLAGQGDGQ